MKTILCSFFVLVSLFGYSQTARIIPRSHGDRTSQFGWSTAQYESWEYERYNVNGSTDYLSFRMLKPKGYDQNASTKYPMIIMLHGAGESGAASNFDNELLLKWGGREHLNAVNNGKFKGFVVFPQDPWGAWSQGFPQDTLSALQVSVALGQMWELVDSLALKYKVDRNRIIIHGLSSGGTGTLASIYHRPDLFAAALPMSASAMVGLWDSVTVEKVRTNMGILAPVPVWWFQGNVDTNPPTWVTEQAIKFLRDSGAVSTDRTRYTVYPNTAHTTWVKAYADPDFFPFINRQSKRKIYVMGNNPICCGKATDLALSKGFVNYQWFRNGAAIKGATTHKLSNLLTAGRYHVTYFRKGSVSKQFSDTITLTGGNVLPVVSLLSPVQNSRVVEKSTVLLSATASDANGLVVKVDFYQGSTLLVSDSLAPYQYNWAADSTGAFMFKAIVNDNFGSAVTSAIKTLFVDPNTPPTINLLSPLAMVHTSPALLRLSATTADVDGTVKKVDFYADTLLLASDTLAPFEYSWENVPSGSYRLRAKAIDNLGDSTLSDSLTVVVTDAPVVSLISPARDSAYALPTTIVLWAETSDADGSIAKVQFFLNDSSLLATVDTLPYRFFWSPSVVGTFSLKAIATDNLGITDTTTSVLVTFTSHENQAPDANLVSPANGATFNTMNLVTLTANASDVDGSVAKVEFHLNDSLVIGTDSVAPYSLIWSKMEPGTYALSVRVFDNEGASFVSPKVQITITGFVGQGYITKQLFNGISGSQVFNLTSNAKYPSKPSFVSRIYSFEGLSNSADNYGTRIIGYICPTQTGNYVFHIAADDRAELWLSPDANPDAKLLIASVPNLVAFHDYSQYTSQTSLPVRLVKGGKYFIQALHKEGIANDHLSVAWTLPSGQLEDPIPGAVLWPAPSTSAREDHTPWIEQEEDMNSGALLLSPNPSSDFVNLTFHTNGEKIQVQVRDAMSTLLSATLFETHAGDNEIRLPLEALSSGVYYITLYSLEGSSTKKMLVNPK